MRRDRFFFSTFYLYPDCFQMTATVEALDGSFRAIKVTVSGAGRTALVRTRTGYYATPETSKKNTRAANP